MKFSTFCEYAVTIVAVIFYNCAIELFMAATFSGLLHAGM
jgi:hypothetical protein